MTSCNFALHLPLNNLSLGQVSFNILLEMHRRGLSPAIFPIGNIDQSSFKFSDDFKFWLTNCIDKALGSHKRDIPTIKLWHLNGSMESFSKDQILFTFYELDAPTAKEINIAKNQKTAIFSSSYSKQIFETSGCSNISFVPLGFDSLSFYETGKEYLKDTVVFSLCGKLEKRKHHAKILRLWNKRFGNDKRYCLNCALFNPFMQVKDQENIIGQALDGKKPFNINFVPYMNSNEAYNDMLNCSSIAIGLSGGEGWELPSFQSVCLGKHAVILNAHVYKDWVNKDCAVLVEPNGKEPAADNIFFKVGADFNQGNIFTWNDDEAIAGMEEAIKKFQTNPINEAGRKLKEKFSYSNTVDKLLALV